MQEFKSIGDFLDEIALSTEQLASATLQEKLDAAWQQYWQGNKTRGKPMLFASGRLVVFVSSSCWGNEIRHSSTKLIQLMRDNGININSIEVKAMPAQVTK